MARLYDMAMMTVSGTPGTGTITLLAAAVADGITYLTFAQSGVANADVVSYRIKDGANWEVGRGTYTTSGTTLTRTPLFSSNANAVIAATSAAVVSIVSLAEDLTQSVTLGGNTAGVSAVTISPTLVFAGGQNITVSGSSNSITLSAPALSSLVAGAGISISTTSNTILIIAATAQNTAFQALSYFAPVPFQGATTSIPSGATMFMVPVPVPEQLVMNMVRLIGTFTLGVLTTATSSKSASASASFASRLSVAIYSQMGGTSSQSYSSLASTVVLFSASQTISQSSASQTNGLSLTYPLGTGTGSSNLSITSNTTTVNPSTTNFNSWREIDIPFAMTLDPGNYIVGFQGTTASAGASALSWSCSFAGMTHLSAPVGLMGATQPSVFNGVGMLSTSATSIVPPSFNAESLSTTASHFRPWIAFVNA